MSVKVRNDNGKSSPLPQVDDCQDCGVCCLHMGYPSYIEGGPTQAAEPFWLDLPQHLRTELIEYRKAYIHPAAGELDGPCFWFDLQTKRCKNHQYRPNVCRDFQVGCADCIGWRKRLGIGEAAVGEQT